jgi:hypothetical protein
LGRSPRRVVLHVGTPKSGTTFLQRVLWDNHDALKAQDFRCAGHRQRDMFLAAVELRESHAFWGYTPEELEGRWSAVCRQARDFHGTTIMSHEVLGGASDEQVARALAELDGIDVHLVLTARDLARQVTSEWQERVKNGSPRPFAKFQKRLIRQMESGQFDKGFWRNQDPVGVLDRWATDLPPENVHVVVAPQSSSDPTLLWRRFAEALDLDTSDIDSTQSQLAANTTLGVAQIQVLRRVNEALAGRIKHPQYARVVKSQFAERLLANQSSTRPQCPPHLVQRLRVLAEERNDTIRQRGYVVHGDLAELLPKEPEGPYRAPDKVGRRVERAAYGDALASLLTQRAAPPRATAAAPVVARATRSGTRFSRLGRFIDDLRSRRG